MTLPFWILGKDRLHQAVDFLACVTELQHDFEGLLLEDPISTLGGHTSSAKLVEGMDLLNNTMQSWFRTTKKELPKVFPFYGKDHGGVPEPPHVQFENIGEVGMMIAYYTTYLCLHDITWRMGSASQNLIRPELQTHINFTALEAAEGCLRLIPWLTGDAQGAEGIMATKFCDGPLSMAKVTYERLGYSSAALECESQLQRSTAANLLARKQYILA